MSNSLNNQIIKSFSSKVRNSRSKESLVNKFEKCGDETIDRINSLNPELVLDLGCGDNQYKGYIKNLIGIDIKGEDADIQADISKLEYKDSSVDACLCYGSINFGDNSVIKKQISEVFRVLKPTGIAVFRGNMNEHNNGMYYGWDEDKVNYWSEYFMFKLLFKPTIVRRLDVNGKIHHNWEDKLAKNTGFNHRSIERLYWIWQK